MVSRFPKYSHSHEPRVRRQLDPLRSRRLEEAPLPRVLLVHLVVGSRRGAHYRLVNRRKRLERVAAFLLRLDSPPQLGRFQALDDCHGVSKARAGDVEETAKEEHAIAKDFPPCKE
jgi:hypothetical protein